MPTISSKLTTFDALAVAASTLCLAHCLMLPLLLVLVPTLTALIAVPDSFHQGMLLFALPMSMIALAAGFRRHRQPLPAIVVVPGLGLLILGGLATEESLEETLLTVAGALLLSIGHTINWQRSSRRATDRPST
ncbi:MerC domain-containing protein [Novosphingobium sp. RD2P27]|uniref:MerC domain-containing protein n=1 Tax=Novosphingobium kalidii TaxID=3230299 RepID=A0ABV2D1L0_9SPHN